MAELQSSGAEQLICAAADLQESGLGVRFEVTIAGEVLPAFVVRHEGQVQAYLNRCAHIPVEMDFQEGDFFELSKTWLVCATHGAAFLPSTGECVSGPCLGRYLAKLKVVEREGQVYWQPHPDDQYLV